MRLTLAMQAGIVNKLWTLENLMTPWWRALRTDRHVQFIGRRRRVKLYVSGPNECPLTPLKVAPDEQVDQPRLGGLPSIRGARLASVAA